MAGVRSRVMIVSNNGIGLEHAWVAIRPAVLHVLPPRPQAVQSDGQGSHRKHADHQVERPGLAQSCGQTGRLTGSMPGEAVPATRLGGKAWRPWLPVLVGQPVW